MEVVSVLLDPPEASHPEPTPDVRWMLGDVSLINRHDGYYGMTVTGDSLQRVARQGEFSSLWQWARPKSVIREVAAAVGLPA